MEMFLKLIKEVNRYSKRKFIGSVILTVLLALADGVGLIMLVPLLALTDISMGNSNVVLTKLSKIMNNLPRDNQFLIILIVYVLLISLKTLLSRRVSILNTELVQGYTKSLRLSLYEDVVNADWQCLSAKKKSDLMNTFTVETSRISFGIVNYLKIISQVIVGGIQLSVAFIMSVPLTLFVSISGLGLFMFLRPTLRESKKLGKSLQLINQELQGEINDQLNGIKEIKSYGIERMQINQFKKTTEKVENNIVNFTKVQSKPDVYYKIGAAIIISLFFYIAVVLLKAETSSMLIIIFIFSKLWPIFSSFQSSLQNIFVILPVYKNMEKLRAELQKEKEEFCVENQSSTVNLRNEITFKDVSFKYNNSSSFQLEDITFRIPAKKITAIVGSSGAGKSTIIDLLLGLLTPTSGQLLVDEIVIDDKIMSNWRRAIGYVPQDTFLLNATIRENLQRFNKDASEEEIREALKLSAAKEFIDNLPKGIDTIIGDRGVRLSGGERQRIILARAILRKPQILVLDEATSALDNENEYKIQKAIDNLRGHITVVVVAHRLTTIKGADNVIAVDNGRIVEMGAYCDLEHKEDGYLNKMLSIK